MPTDVRILAVDATDDWCSRVMETALDAGITFGIGYWAAIGDDIVYEPRLNFETKAHEERVKSFAVIDDGKRHQVTRLVIRNGLLLALQGGWSIKQLTEDLDGPTSDVVIQFGIFNEQKYG